MPEQKGSILTTVLLAVGLAVAVGAGVYFWQTQQAAQQKAELAQLKIQLTNLQTGNANGRSLGDIPNVDVQPLLPDLTMPEPAPTCTLCDEIPVVIFTPSGLFTEAEKDDLYAKAINPYFDYRNADEVNFVAMQVEKYNPVPDHGYKYNIEAFSKTGGYEGFLYGQSEPLEWWHPECMGSCNFSAEFSAKYPEIVALGE